MSKIAAVCAGFLLLALTAAAGLVAAVFYLNEAPAGAPRNAEQIILQKNGDVLLEVTPGESAASVGRRLANAGIIKSAFFWHIIGRVQKDYIKAGFYKIELPQKALSLYRILIAGEEIHIAVTVPEGSTLKKTSSIWAEAGVCSREAFIKAATDASVLKRYSVAGTSMEGFLYPDTYYVPPVYPAEKIIALMAGTFFKRLEDAGLSAGSPQEVYKRVTLASIVEREYRVADEAPLIAGVFQNRLDTGMRLESCATVEYIITEIEGKAHPKRLWEQDTKIQNPYNTYIVSGLPPGPIASPGLLALQAAFSPEPSDYLFFRLINSASGKHYFSRTFDDHIKAAALFVKG